MKTHRGAATSVTSRGGAAANSAACSMSSQGIEGKSREWNHSPPRLPPDSFRRLGRDIALRGPRCHVSSLSIGLCGPNGVHGRRMGGTRGEARRHHAFTKSIIDTIRIVSPIHGCGGSER